MEDFKELVEKERPRLDNINRFNENDIVYLVPTAGASKEWPAIGSKHEIDLKVIHFYNKGVFINAGGSVENDWRYELITGYGFQLTGVREKSLVAAHERSKFFESLVLSCDTELAPKGSIFVKIPGYYSCEALGIYISNERMETIKQHFTNKL